MKPAKTKGLSFIAEHKTGHKEEVDLYWFAWHYIKDIDNSNSDWKFYVYVNGSLVHTT